MQKFLGDRYCFIIHLLWALLQFSGEPSKPPYEKVITQAIPLILEAFRDVFRDTTFDFLDKVFNKRFERAAVRWIFFAVLFSTIWNIEETKTSISKEKAYTMSVQHSYFKSTSPHFLSALSTVASHIRRALICRFLWLYLTIWNSRLQSVWHSFGTRSVDSSLWCSV